MFYNNFISYTSIYTSLGSHFVLQSQEVHVQLFHQSVVQIISDLQRTPPTWSIFDSQLEV